jgi:tetratricopeptide (TPR) repeat protein
MTGINNIQNDRTFSTDNTEVDIFLTRPYKKTGSMMQLISRLGTLFHIGEEEIPVNRQRAEKLFEHVLELNPNSELARIYLGLFYHTGKQGVAKNDQTTRKVLEHAVMLEPNDVIALSLLSALLKTPGQGFEPDEARAAALLNRAYSLDPELTQFCCKNIKIELPASIENSITSNTTNRGYLYRIRQILSRFLGML